MTDATVSALQEAGRYLQAHDLTWGSAGNLSARSPGSHTYWITASGTRLGELSESDLVACGLDGTLPAGPVKPSKERPMHQAVYALRPEINAVLHASPFYSTLVACSELELPNNWFVENMYYLERVARVRYCHAGSAALGEAVAEKAAAANVILLENHGVLVYDTSVREALMALHTLEMVCKMLVTARAGQIPMRPLPADTVSDFLNHAGYRARRQWER